MSRTATATPPPPYFPQRNVTPSMRHSAAPIATAAHFRFSPHVHLQHHGSRRKVKQLPTALGSLAPSKKATVSTPIGEPSINLEASFEEVPLITDEAATSEFYRTQSTVSTASVSTTFSGDESSVYADLDASLLFGRAAAGRSDSVPSMTTSIAESYASTDLPTPSAMDDASFLDLQDSATIANTTSTGVSWDGNPASSANAQQKSWVPNFGRMAKAVVSTGIMGLSFPEKRNKKGVCPYIPTAPLASRSVNENFFPFTYSSPPLELVQHLPPDEARQRGRDWTEAQHKRVLESARLCSQWPLSGYNVTKFGPAGSRGFYEPQTSCNAAHVKAIFERQTDLEQYLIDHSASHYPSHRNRDSDSDTDPSVDSFDSSLPSPTASMLITSDDALNTAANIKAAMASPLINGLSSASELSLLPISPRSLKNAKSLSELDTFAASMALSRDDMEIDSEPASLVSSQVLEVSRLPIPNRPARAHSCGSKRPLATQGDEEEKRRKVDEAMVVEDAVNSGVIVPPSASPVSTVDRMSASTPNLGQTQPSAAVFGHVVKTSDTHPIIISPFFPNELLPILAEHLIMPRTTGPWSTIPLALSSDIDVPAMLLSQPPPSQAPAPVKTTIVPSPIQTTFDHRWHTRSIGNLLLSSCPGKRLRMDGPVKGRGPVFRDLTTDLKRIKGEGVGCLVCCLDDAELALLGTPWDTYRDVASDVGLDILRVPMPDGFTPVSLGFFDSQISLIVTKYTLKGINVLVHCRGGVGRAGLTACAWAIKMGFVQPHPTLAVSEKQASSSVVQQDGDEKELEHQIVMSIVERVIAMIRSRRGLKAIESFEQVQFLGAYVRWLRAKVRG